MLKVPRVSKSVCTQHFRRQSTVPFPPEATQRSPSRNQKPSKPPTHPPRPGHPQHGGGGLCPRTPSPSQPWAPEICRASAAALGCLVDLDSGNGGDYRLPSGSNRSGAVLSVGFPFDAHRLQFFYWSQWRILSDLFVHSFADSVKSADRQKWSGEL